MMENYKCTLNEASIKKAKEELNEDPKDRLGAVDAFRQWLLQQPHLKSPSDTKYLLRFLRLAHFSQLEARKVMEKYLKNKTEIPEWFNDIDTKDKRVQAFLKSGYILVLPGVNDEGRKIIFCRIAKLDTECKDYDKHTIYKTFFLFTMFLLDDENVQVNGFEVVMDFTNMTHAQSTYVGLETSKKSMDVWQGGIPARFKLYHYYNTGPMFDALLAIIRPFIPKKMERRLNFHGSNLEKIYKHVPLRMMPDEYLPDDYTGLSAGPADQILENMLKDLDNEKLRQRLLEETKSEYCADESKRPQDVPVASFRRLNVD